MSIFPYAYRMIESFEVTEDKHQVSKYAGMLITAFAFAEFVTGMMWSYTSDRLGRKPVLIMGLIGTSISMICFGFAKTLPGAIGARALGGLLNGNVAVLQTALAELVTNKEHRPRAYSVLPSVWCLGSIIGPAIGGALAVPCEAYPRLFLKETVVDTFPFLLPNLVCVVILVLSIMTGCLFLEETHPLRKQKADYGLELGKLLLRRFCGSRATRMYIDEEEIVGIGDELSPGYRSTGESSKMCTRPKTFAISSSGKFGDEAKLGLCATFNKQVVLIIAGYMILAYHSISFDSLMPVFLSEARSTKTPSLPFQLDGGLGLPTRTIGLMMAVQGGYSMVAQLWLFPFIVRKVGTLLALRIVMVVWPLLYLAVPYLVLLPHRSQMVGVYVALVVKMTFHVVAFPSVAMLLANAATSKSVLGKINGAAASFACLARAFGPTITGSMHAAGLQFGCNGIAWWAAGIVCAVGALQSFWIVEYQEHADALQAEEVQPLCDQLYHSSKSESEDAALSRRSDDSTSRA